jgi:outer membrane protein OmpA-like peptidoglycan-associated protein
MREIWLASAALCAASVHARADDLGGDIPLDGFRPALDARGFVTVDGGEVLAPGEPSFGLVTTWSRGLLELGGDGARYRVDDVVSPTLLAAIGVPAGLELAAALPFGVIAADRDPDVAPDDGRTGGQGVGDLALHAKLRVVTTERWAIAAIAGATLPTATSRSWLGSGAAAVTGRAVVEWRAGRWRLAGNVGARVRTGGDAVYRDDTGAMATGATVAMGPAIPGGVAASWAITPGRLAVIGELTGQFAARGDYRPVETRVALRVELAAASHFTIGAGTGLTGGAGSPDGRAFAAIIFEPGAARRRRAALEDPEPVPPDAPRAGDRDHDRIVDTLDACPDEPEDHDGYQDDDGCPDVDNDGDGLLDHEDLCIDEPEDHDGVDDDDGCPETDADDDGLLDHDDPCPLDRRNGCAGRGQVAVTDTGIDVFEDIFFDFDSANIQQRSHAILRVVARTILSNPELRLIEIGGHTDARGDAAYNRALSQRRADAVRTFLIDEGVDGDRLEATGYGEDRPRLKGSGEKVWSQNRRVEFLIVRRRNR